MSLTAQVDSQKPNRLQETAFLNVNFDSTTSWGTDSALVARQVENNGVVVNLLMLQNSVTFDQNRALRAMLNLYEEFTVREISVEWIPRFPHILAANTAANMGLAGVGGFSKELINLYYRFFCESAEVWMVPDMDDTQVANNDAGSFYLARSKPGAVHATTVESCKLTFSPHIQDMVLTQLGNTVAGGVASGLYAPLASISMTDSGAGAGSLRVGTVSKPMGWLPTRIYTAENGSTGPTGQDFNVFQTLFGFKYWFYTPFNSTSDNFNRGNVGIFRYNFQLAFRKPETRQWLIPSSEFIESSSSFKKRKLLAELTGEQLLSHGVRPEFTVTQKYHNDKIAAEGKQPAVNAPHDFVSEEELDRKLDVAIKAAEAKRATQSTTPTPVTAEGPKQSALSTPLSRLSQAIPGRRG